MTAPTISSGSDSPPRVVFVIGAGRSGTSTVTRALMALGVDLGDRFKRASRKNPTGFFEDADLLALSKQVRQRIGVRADSVRLIEADELQGEPMADLRETAGRIIRERFGKSPVWGFKYGRTLRILPFWEPVLKELGHEPSFLIALRNPLSVARSRAKLDPRRGLQEASDLEWLVSIVPYLRRTRGYRLAVVDYDELMDRPVDQLLRIARQLALPADQAGAEQVRAYAEQFLDPGLRHSRFEDAALDRDPALNPLVRDAYRLLRQLATGERELDDRFWQDWQRVEQGVADLAPVLRLVDLRENERRRAILSPLGPFQSLSLLKPWFKR
ncbi:MAG: sulfotransferase family protein [Wenzhouxiangella sp.]